MISGIYLSIKTNDPYTSINCHQHKRRLIAHKSILFVGTYQNNGHATQP
jgi:hypothetical protein